MDSSKLLLLVGILLGAALVYFVRPFLPTTGEELLGGKYLVIQGEYGHWVYEETEEGFEIIVKELTPAGLRAIWEIQSDYMPRSVSVGDEQLLSVSATQYSTESGAFNIVHQFYRFDDGKLIEAPMLAVRSEQP